MCNLGNPNSFTNSSIPIWSWVRLSAFSHPNRSVSGGATASTAGRHENDQRYGELKNSYEPTLAARLDVSAKAKQGLLERIRKSRTENAPALAARQAALRARSAAKAARAAEKKAARQAERARKAEAFAAEEAALAPIRAAEEERLKAEATEKERRAAERAAEQKAARDARYASRKARKRR